MNSCRNQNRDQGVPAEFEEVIVDTNSFYPQLLFPDRYNYPLNLVSRRHIGTIEVRTPCEAHRAHSALRVYYLTVRKKAGAGQKRPTSVPLVVRSKLNHGNAASVTSRTKAPGPSAMKTPMSALGKGALST